ncbi:MAG: YvcK family protein [Bacilli bacterium]|nr:MAG: YvcK family protein [Bacilli bacterium]
MKKIVVLGGGTGLSVLLKGLKQFPFRYYRYCNSSR